MAISRHHLSEIPASAAMAVVPPVNVTMPGLHTSFPEKRRFSLSVFAADVRNCALLGGLNSIAVGDSLYVRQFEHNPVEVAFERWGATHSVGPTAAVSTASQQRVWRPVTVIGSTSNYYHWIVDHLARLALINSRLDPSGRRLLVSSTLTPWQRDSLLRLGVDLDAVETYRPDQTIHLDDARLVACPARYGYVLPAAIQALRQAIAPPLDRARKEAIFLWRHSVGHRHVAGQEAMADALVREGVRIVDPASLTFAEQVKALSGASAIIGCHGAALTNMIWAPPGCRVIEILSADYMAHYYELLARACGLHHSFAVTGSAAEDAGTLPPAYKRGMTITPATIAAVIALLSSHSERRA